MKWMKYSTSSNHHNKVEEISLPCDDCLCFAICKSKCFNEKTNFILLEIIRKCQNLYSYYIHTPSLKVQYIIEYFHKE